MAVRMTRSNCRSGRLSAITDRTAWSVVWAAPAALAAAWSYAPLEMTVRATSSQALSSATVFWRYWTGSTISKLGTAVTSVALPLTAVLVVHASAFSVAAISAAGSLPWLLLGFPAGVYVTRLPLRGVQVAMDLLRAAAIGSVPVVGWVGGLTVAQLLAVALAVGSASVIFAVANSTLMPAIVPKEELTKRNSLIVASSGIASLSGPGLGGVLVGAMGAASCMVLDAVSYLVSAVMLGTLPRPDSRPAPKAPPSFRTQLSEGFAYIGTRPVLRTALVLVTISNLISAALIALAPLYIVRTLHEHAFVIGAYLRVGGGRRARGSRVRPTGKTMLGVRLAWCCGARCRCRWSWCCCRSRFTRQEPSSSASASSGTRSHYLSWSSR